MAGRGVSDKPERKPEARQIGLLRAGLSVSSMTMLSRIAGLARDVMLARFLGVSALTDAFFIAFRIPNFLRRLFGEGAFAQAFVPVLSEYREKRSAAEVTVLLNAVTGTLGSVLLLVTALGLLAAPLITWLFAPGFAGDAALFDTTATLLRVMFPYLLLISLAALAGSILNSYGRFAVPAFTPVWLNLCLMGGAWLGVHCSDQPVLVLAWAVTLGGFVQLAFQLPFLARIQRLPVRPRIDWQHEGVRRILKLMLPAMFGVSISQINLLLNTAIASFLPTGSVTWLYFADRLTELPLGLFGAAITTVVLPSLARQHAQAAQAVFSDTLAWALRLVLVLALPASLALILLAEPIIASLFQYQRTTPNDVLMAAWALRAYALGIVFIMLARVLAMGFHARQDTATPVRIGLIAIAANMGLNLLLVYPLHQYWGLGHVGLALSVSLSAALNALLLGIHLHRQGLLYWPAVYWRATVAVVLATASMGLLLFWITPEAQQWFDWRWWQRLSCLLGLCAAGAGLYFTLLYAAGLRLADFRRRA